MAVKFSNAAKTTLSANISATATTLAVADASDFPTFSGSDYTYATLENTAYDREVVKVTAISGNSLTVIRGQDSTTARTFVLGDKCELRLNAAMLDDATFSGDFDDLANKPVVGDNGLSQKNFTLTLKNKLDAIAAGANNYALPFTNNSSNWNTAHGWGNHATQSYATTSDVTAAITNLIDSSPATLNTLNEIAAALGDDANFSTTITNSIGTKMPLAGGTMTGNLLIQKTSPVIILDDSNTSDTSFPAIEFHTNNEQDIRLYHNEFDSQLPVAGYGLVVDCASTNACYPTEGTLSFVVKGEIYSGSKILSSTKRVWHEGNFDAIKDEDNMASNSATALATQQSIKAYVDATSPSTLSYSGSIKAQAVESGVDLSGSLRVGQTSTYVPGYGTTTEGLSLRSEGELYVSRSNFSPVSLNRNSDGDIIGLRRSGNGIGFIGINNSENLFVGASANARHSYLNFTTGTQVEILPAQATGSPHDNAINLGKSDNRFKDLYLAGGTYLGGTSSTNKLDHYEEGSWTPGLTVQSGSFTISSSSGKYTRIGNLMFISGKIQLSSENSSGTVKITGLPSSIASGAVGIISFHYANMYALYAGLTGYITTNVINMREQNSSGTEDPNLTPSSLLEFSGQYQV